MAEALGAIEEIQRTIKAGHFKEALKMANSVEEENSSKPELFYMKAVCYRYLGESKLALGALERLKALSPENGRAYQEEGHIYRSLGKTQEAITAFERATQYNPALEVSFQAQLELLDEEKQPQRFKRAREQLDQLCSLPKPLAAVLDLLAQEKILKAEQLCRQFMRKNPRNLEGMRLLAEIGLRFGVLEDAEYLLETVVEADPTHTDARIDFIKVLRKRQNYEKALEQAKTLVDRDPKSLRFKSVYAIECMQTGDFDEAVARFDEILRRLPRDPVTLISRGHALKTQGFLAEAISSYRRAIEAYPQCGEAFYSLANLKTYKFSEKEMSAMTSLLDQPDLSYMDRVYVNFALGKAHEDNKNYVDSFVFYRAGNSLKKTRSRYSAEKMSAELNAQAKICTHEFFAQRSDFGCKAPDPIFILGLPRAGSTLVEQILSSHSQIDGTMELPNILSLSQRLRRLETSEGVLGYPAVLEKLSSAQAAEFGNEFIKDTQIHRERAPFFIDKMPNNFRHIGLIKLILPNAKVIDARRNPMDCCFSGFKQLFAEGQEFTYDLSDVGQYYSDYLKLMSHWDSVLPGFVLRVTNEDVIDDLEKEVRRMLNFCGLPFEEACLNFNKTERNVRTPSSEQVRRPVNRDGQSQWEPYSDFLEPLKKALGAS